MVAVDLFLQKKNLHYVHWTTNFNCTTIKKIYLFTQHRSFLIYRKFGLNCQLLVKSCSKKCTIPEEEIILMIFMHSNIRRHFYNVIYIVIKFLVMI